NISRVWSPLAILISSSPIFISCQSQESKEAKSTQWIDPSKLQPGPIRHENLSDEQISRIGKVQAVFADVDSTPLDKWIDDFKRDVDPDHEIAIWEAMAHAYKGVIDGKNWPLEKREELLGILLVGSSAPIDEAMKHVKLSEVSESEAREVLR